MEFFLIPVILLILSLDNLFSIHSLNFSFCSKDYLLFNEYFPCILGFCDIFLEIVLLASISSNYLDSNSFTLLDNSSYKAISSYYL